MSKPVPTYESQIAIQPLPGVRLSGLDSIGDLADRAASKLFGQAAKRVAKDSYLAGQQAGLDAEPGTLVLPDGSSISDEEFRRGAIATSQMKMALALETQIDDLSLKHEADPVALDASLQAVKNQWLSKGDPETKLIAETIFTRKSAQALQQAKIGAVRVAEDQAKAAFVPLEERKSRELEFTAYNGGNTTGALNEYMGLLEKAGPRGSRVLSETQISKLTMDAIEKATIANLTGKFERVNTIGEKKKLIGQIDDGIKNKSYSVDLSTMVRLKNSFEADVRQEEAHQRALAAQARAEQRAVMAEKRLEFKETVQNHLAMLSNGERPDRPLSRNDLDGMYDDPKDADKVWSKLEIGIIQAGRIGELSSMSYQDQLKLVQDAAPKPSDTNYAERDKDYKELIGMVDKVRTQRLSDPVSALVKVRPELAAAFTSNDPAVFGAAVKQASTLQSELFGLAPAQVRPLPKNMAMSIADGVNTAESSDAAISMLSRYTLSLGNNAVAQRVLNQLVDSGLDPAYSSALDAVARGDLSSASRLAATATMSPKAFPKGDVAVKDINMAVDQAFLGKEASGVVSRMAALSGNTKALAHDKELIHKLTSAAVASGKSPDEAAKEAVKTVYGDVISLVDESRAIVALPKEVDATKFIRGVEAVRGSLDLSHYMPSKEAMAKTIKGTSPEDTTSKLESAFAVATMERERTIKDLKNNSVMVANGTGYSLLDTLTGRLIARADGQPFVWALDEVLGSGSVTAPVEADTLPLFLGAP